MCRPRSARPAFGAPGSTSKPHPAKRGHVREAASEIPGDRDAGAAAERGDERRAGAQERLGPVGLQLEQAPQRLRGVPAVRSSVVTPNRSRSSRGR